MYFLWVGREQFPSFLPQTPYYHRVKTSNQAIKHIEKHGMPLIISFGCASEKFARYMKSLNLDPSIYTFRVHSESNKAKIMEIMK